MLWVSHNPKQLDAKRRTLACFLCSRKSRWQFLVPDCVLPARYHIIFSVISAKIVWKKTLSSSESVLPMTRRCVWRGRCNLWNFATRRAMKNSAAKEEPGSKRQLLFSGLQHASWLLCGICIMDPPSSNFWVSQSIDNVEGIAKISLISSNSPRIKYYEDCILQVDPSLLALPVALRDFSIATWTVFRLCNAAIWAFAPKDSTG